MKGINLKQIVQNNFPEISAENLDKLLSCYPMDGMYKAIVNVKQLIK